MTDQVLPRTAYIRRESLAGLNRFLDSVRSRSRTASFPEAEWAQCEGNSPRLHDVGPRRLGGASRRLRHPAYTRQQAASDRSKSKSVLRVGATRSRGRANVAKLQPLLFAASAVAIRRPWPATSSASDFFRPRSSLAGRAFFLRAASFLRGRVFFLAAALLLGGLLGDLLFDVFLAAVFLDAVFFGRFFLEVFFFAVFFLLAAFFFVFGRCPRLRCRPSSCARLELEAVPAGLLQHQDRREGTTEA